MINQQFLGTWLKSVLSCRKGKNHRAELTAEQIARLDALGMIWQPEDPWNAKFRLVQQYYEAHGHTNMPTDYVVEGVWLRRWLSEQKARLNGVARSAKGLSVEQAELLATVGIFPSEKSAK